MPPPPGSQSAAGFRDDRKSTIDWALVAAERLQLKSGLFVLAVVVVCAMQWLPVAAERWAEGSNFESVVVRMLSPPHSAVHQVSRSNQTPAWTAFADPLFRLRDFP
jgi:hypothetical protein